MNGETLALVVAVLCAAALGYLVALYRHLGQRQALARQEDLLDAEWTALEQTQRVRQAYYQARTALRDLDRMA